MYTKRVKDLIKDFKSERKKDGDGIETAIFNVLKNNYAIKLQASHGGILHGKDHQKIMNSADEIFILFAAILKLKKMQKRPASCPTTISMNYVCQKYVIYERFVTAAVHLHKDLGMNVTPKVNLMWKHVKHQMKFPTGLSTNTKLRGGG